MIRLIKLILFIIFLSPTKAYPLIEIDITRGNLDPLPIAVSPLFQDDNSKKNSINELKLENVYKKVGNFDHKQFLEGAKKAFEIIITSFNNGDKNTLKDLVSNSVYSAFDKAIDNKEIFRHLLA